MGGNLGKTMGNSLNKKTTENGDFMVIQWVDIGKSAILASMKNWAFSIVMSVYQRVRGVRGDRLVEKIHGNRYVD